MSTGVRDTLIAFAVVGALLGGLFLYAGAWPPLVVIESGSMMHPVDTVPYGRFGTIDPGDIVFIKKVRSREDVTTWAQAAHSTYGKAGDVIIYAPYNNSEATPIIHRAMAWVDVVVKDGRTEYHVEWVDGETLVFNRTGIYLPELGFDEARGFTPLNGYRPPYSGFITKGDNPVSNAAADQAGLTRQDRLSDLVQVSWIQGVSRGEIPWFGLVKLIFSQKVNQANPNWVQIGNAFAPYDLWTMLGFSIVAIVLMPLAYDVLLAWRERREYKRDAERERRRREEEERGEGGGDAPNASDTEGSAPSSAVTATLPPGASSSRAVSGRN